MTIFTDPLNLIFLAIAVFAGFRLWQVLGQRPSTERPAPIREFDTEPLPTDLELKAATPPSRNSWQGHATEGSALAKRFDELAARDLQFDSNLFLDWAKSAHEAILNAFAAGNLEVLKASLTSNTFSIFENEIMRRKAMGEVASFKFVSIKRAAINDAQTTNANGRVEVAFTSSVFSAIKNAKGEVISGNDKRMAEVAELWTFERNLNDTASPWRLSETHDLIENA